jgi:hypothetical protein
MLGACTEPMAQNIIQDVQAPVTSASIRCARPSSNVNILWSVTASIWMGRGVTWGVPNQKWEDLTRASSAIPNVTHTALAVRKNL